MCSYDRKKRNLKVCRNILKCNSTTHINIYIILLFINIIINTIFKSLSIILVLQEIDVSKTGYIYTLYIYIYIYIINIYIYIEI